MQLQGKLSSKCGCYTLVYAYTVYPYIYIYILAISYMHQINSFRWKERYLREEGKKNGYIPHYVIYKPNGL